MLQIALYEVQAFPFPMNLGLMLPSTNDNSCYQSECSDLHIVSFFFCFKWQYNFVMDSSILPLQLSLE